MQAEEKVIELQGKLDRIRELLEEMWALPFEASEEGLGPGEITDSEARLEKELQQIVGFSFTCGVCLFKFKPEDNHDCLKDFRVWEGL